MFELWISFQFRWENTWWKIANNSIKFSCTQTTSHSKFEWRKRVSSVHDPIIEYVCEMHQSNGIWTCSLKQCPQDAIGVISFLKFTTSYLFFNSYLNKHDKVWMRWLSGEKDTLYDECPQKMFLWEDGRGTARYARLPVSLTSHMRSSSDNHFLSGIQRRKRAP